MAEIHMGERQEDFKGKVKSYIRVRDFIDKEKGPWAFSTDEQTASITVFDGKGKERKFRCGAVIGCNKTQKDVFNQVGRPVVDAMLSASGCDGSVICYGGKTMGKSHTLLETSSQDEGLLVRVAHELLRAIHMTKFSPQSKAVQQEKILQVSTVAIKYSGEVLTFNSKEKGANVSEVISTPKTYARLNLHKRENNSWTSCSNATEFEAKLQRVLTLYRSRPIVNKSSAKDGNGIQFIVVQFRILETRSEVDLSFFSKVAFILVAPGESMPMEGPVLTGTHLSASMLRLRSVLDSITGTGVKSKMLRAIDSLVDVVSAPLGSKRALGIHKEPFACLLGCISPQTSTSNEICGLLSFAERVRSSQLLHAKINQMPHVKGAEDVHTPSSVQREIKATPSKESLQKSILSKQLLAKTPPFVNAMNRLMWPAASPGTFQAGLSDLAHMRDELESIWVGLHEAERYHQEALSAAETELQEAETATRRAGARATEMRKILASLRTEIENQKVNLARKESQSDVKLTEGGNENILCLKSEIKQLREQVKDEQTLRREAEAAFAALDDECSRLRDRNKGIDERLKKLEEGTSQPNVNHNFIDSSTQLKTRNVRIQCALGQIISQPTNTNGVHLVQSVNIVDPTEHAASSEDLGANNESEHSKKSNKIFDIECIEIDEDPTFSSDPTDPDTPTLLKKETIEGTSDLANDGSESCIERGQESAKLQQVIPQQAELPEGGSIPIRKGPSYSVDNPSYSGVEDTLDDLDSQNDLSIDQTHFSHDTSFQTPETQAEDNPVNLIISVNMYKGHKEKVVIRLYDTPEEVASKFVQKHNLPEIATRNLERLIEKHLESNGMKSVTKNTESTPTPMSSQYTFDNLSNNAEDMIDTPDGLSSREHKSIAEAVTPSESLESASRPLRPVDMYRFLN